VRRRLAQLRAWLTRTASDSPKETTRTASDSGVEEQDDERSRHVSISVGGAEFYGWAGDAIAQVVDAHELDFEPELASALADCFVLGAKLGVAELTAALIECGIDAKVDFDQVRLTR
jgi:hypothetical protein